MKYLLLAILFAAVGVPIGVKMAGYMYAQPLLVVNGRAHSGCGMIAIGILFWGSLIGMVVGGTLGVVVAWLLPRSPRTNL